MSSDFKAAIMNVEFDKHRNSIEFIKLLHLKMHDWKWKKNMAVFKHGYSPIRVVWRSLEALFVVSDLVIIFLCLILVQKLKKKNTNNNDIHLLIYCRMIVG